VFVLEKVRPYDNIKESHWEKLTATKTTSRMIPHWYLVFGEETQRGQLVFAVVVAVHQSEGLGQPGLQLRAVQQQLEAVHGQHKMLSQNV